MENQTSSAKSIMLNYGVILAFISILLNVSLFAMGKVYDPHWSVAIISIGATIVILVLALKKFKESKNGFLSLSEALKIGLGTALISGFVYVVYNLIFVNFIEPEYYSRMIEFQEQNMLEKFPNMSDERIESSIEITKKLSGPAIGSAMIIVSSLFFGFIVSLIAGLIMKKTEDQD